MSSGLLALLDDVAAIAKAAAASVDDVAMHAGRAGAKAAGVVIDDAAVTPRYVIGFDPARELPIIFRIALGSLRNKLLILLPAALALSAFAPWAVTPLLMLGGAYLCFEGTEKAAEWLGLMHHAHGDGPADHATDARQLEDARVAGAIKTDFILSAEIMAITLAAVPDASFWTRLAVLAIVGVVITVAVYGVVALIVKADDAGVALARRRPAAIQAIGRAMVRGMPVLLRVLSVVGTAAMIWVGGGILLHGLEALGLGGLAHLVHDISAAAGAWVPRAADLVSWLVAAMLAGMLGLAVGAALIPLADRVFRPIADRLAG